MATTEIAWAGNFDCGQCGRKRLVGAEFSKAALERHRRDPSAPLKCKACVDTAAEAERVAAAARRQASDEAGTAEEHVCSACEQPLAAAMFNRNQLNKGPGKQRCQQCVADAEKAASSAGDAAYAERLASARTALARAEAAGTPAERLAASAHLSAIEAEKVTGLKPIKLRARGGGGGRRGSGRGGGRGGGGRASA